MEIPMTVSGLPSLLTRLFYRQSAEDLFERQSRLGRRKEEKIIKGGDSKTYIGCAVVLKVDETVNWSPFLIWKTSPQLLMPLIESPI
jgi:hypothetical protein